MPSALVTVMVGCGVRIIEETVDNAVPSTLNKYGQTTKRVQTVIMIVERVLMK